MSESRKPEGSSSPKATSYVRAPPPLQSEREREKPKIGEWNHFEMLVGKRGTGKSTKMLERMLDLDAIANGAYKLAHSLGQRFPSSLPSKREYQLRYHETIESLDRWLRREPDDIHVFISDDAQPLLEYAQQLGRSIKRAALGIWNRKGSPLGKEATPIIVGIDEMIALDAAMGSAQGKDSSRWFRKLLVSLRHEHIALIAGIQDSNAISYINNGLATRIYCFKTTHLYAQQALRAGGMEEEDLSRLKTLGVGEYIEVEG